MPIYKGNTKIVKLYKGSTQIVKRYKGTDLIYSASRLPSAFQEVEYLQSTGTQYIGTNFISTINSKLICDVAFTNLNNNQVNGIYSSTCRIQFGILNSVFWFGVGNKQINTIYSPDLLKHIFTIDLKNKEYGIDSDITSDTSISVGANSKQLLLFCMLNATADSPVLYCNQKLYSCQIYDNNTLIRDFVPCYRKADNVAGLYDLVNGVFYTNAGTGTFVVGGNV